MGRRCVVGRGVWAARGGGGWKCGRRGRGGGGLGRSDDTGDALVSPPDLFYGFFATKCKWTREGRRWASLRRSGPKGWDLHNYSLPGWPRLALTGLADHRASWCSASSSWVCVAVAPAGEDAKTNHLSRRRPVRRK